MEQRTPRGNWRLCSRQGASFRSVPVRLCKLPSRVPAALWRFGSHIKRRADCLPGLGLQRWTCLALLLAFPGVSLAQAPALNPPPEPIGEALLPESGVSVGADAGTPVSPTSDEVRLFDVPV